MEITKFETQEEWMQARRGCLTGSKVSGLVGGGATKDQIKGVLDYHKIEYKKTALKPELEALLTPEMKKELDKLVPEKITFYELIAERLAVRPESEHPMIRGNRLESEAMARFEEATGKKLNTDLVIWRDEEIPSLAISPDGYVEPKGKSKKITEAAEGKCLASSRHVEALITQEIPEDYKEQAAWYFVLNMDLETLYFCLYDPRMVIHDFFYLTIKRSDFAENYLEDLRAQMISKMEKVEEKYAELIKGTDLEF